MKSKRELERARRTSRIIARLRTLIAAHPEVCQKLADVADMEFAVIFSAEFDALLDELDTDSVMHQRLYGAVTLSCFEELGLKVSA